MAHSAPSHVTQDELRAALTAGASQRSPAWNWNAELADRESTELDGLRRHVADLQAHTAQLREQPTPQPGPRKTSALPSPGWPTPRPGNAGE